MHNVPLEAFGRVEGQNVDSVCTDVEALSGRRCPQPTGKVVAVRSRERGRMIDRELEQGLAVALTFSLGGGLSAFVLNCSLIDSGPNIRNHAYEFACGLAQ